MTTIKKRENKEIYRDGDKLVKVFDEKGFTKAEVLNEALNNARVEETGLKIPKLLNVSKVDGGWAITREYGFTSCSRKRRLWGIETCLGLHRRSVRAWMLMHFSGG